MIPPAVRRVNRVVEFLIEKAIALCGIATILFVILIFVFLLRDALPVLKAAPLPAMLFGKDWYPTDVEDMGLPAAECFGMLPLILGSLLVTVGAIVVGVPLGVAAAIYIGEVASPRVREILKPTVEVLAAIPSVVIGFIGLVLLAPFMQNAFHLNTGLTALTGAIMLAFMAMPTIISISEDALHAVPQDYKAAAYALGATKWQTIWRVLVPAARSGILAAIMLGVGRAIGETMTVLMVTGNAAVIPASWQALLGPVRTLTATIAAEMGETAHYSAHYNALFLIGAILFAITFVINLVADAAIRRVRT
jgi:phosphate transport system permease protein